MSAPTARADQRFRGEHCSFRRSVRVAHSWSTHPRAPSSQVSLLCGAHFLGHLSPQQEMTGLAVGPCCTAVAHRTFPAAPFAASAGDRSMDAWHPPCHHTTHHNPHHCAPWCDAASPSPPCECPLSASGRPATSERGVPGRTTAVRRTGRWPNWRCGRRSAGRSRMCGESGDGTNTRAARRIHLNYPYKCVIFKNMSPPLTA